MSTESQKIAFIAISNKITSGRINTIMHQRGWSCKICSDGDEAVDEYVKLRPDIVFIGLNLTTLNGHIAALEMRESDQNARIAFVTSKTRISKAEDAAYSAGAVGILITPLTQTKIDQEWDNLFSDIPDAPGLTDLDELYPDIPPRIGNLPPLPTLIPLLETPNLSKPKKKKRTFLKIIILISLMLSITGIMAFLGILQTPEFLNNMIK